MYDQIANIQIVVIFIGFTVRVAFVACWVASRKVRERYGAHGTRGVAVSECQLVMVTVVEYVHEVGVERVDILRAFKAPHSP